MNKKEKRLSARQAAEKAVIRDEQNRRLAYAATNPIKDVLNDLHTALSGLDMESVSASRIRHGSNKVTHVKKKVISQTAGRCIYQSVYSHIVLFGSCFHRHRYGISVFFSVWQRPGGF